MSRFLSRQTLLDPVTHVATKSAELLTHVRDGAGDLVSSAMNFLGVPYRRGGSSVDSGFDCSGFTRHVFETSVGLLLPRRADEQAHEPSLLKVDLKDLKPGDLVFFNTLRRTFSHVGIYLGEGKFIHSPKPGETVRVEDMRISYWARRFTGGRRAPGLDDANATRDAALASATTPGLATGGADASLVASLSPTLSTSLSLPSSTSGTAHTPGPLGSPRAAAPSATVPARPAAFAPRSATATAPLPALDPRFAPPLGDR
jgi:hypothetical protein